MGLSLIESLQLKTKAKNIGALTEISVIAGFFG